ncbi:MAG TPA: 5-formyltetrahydrofolate cyclo-ligase [Candidatus Nanopelagicaceae bacterium]
MNTAEQKRALRDRFRRERRDRYVASTFVYLLSAPEMSKATCVTSYLSVGDEPSTHELNRELISRGITVLLPRVAGKALQWVEWDGDMKNLKETRKLLEPIGKERTDVSDVDVMIVPALHIDQDGYRLGQGGGYYDRTMPNMPGWKVGIVYPGEITGDLLPRDEWDVRLSAAATPDLIVRFGQ